MWIGQNPESDGGMHGAFCSAQKAGEKIRPLVARTAMKKVIARLRQTNVQ